MSAISGDHRSAEGGKGRAKKPRNPKAIIEFVKLSIRTNGELKVISITPEDWENLSPRLPQQPNLSATVLAISGGPDMDEIPWYLEFQRLDGNAINSKDYFTGISDKSGTVLEIAEWHHKGGSKASIIREPTAPNDPETWSKQRVSKTAAIPISSLDVDDRNTVENIMYDLIVKNAIKLNELDQGAIHGDS